MLASRRQFLPLACGIIIFIGISGMDFFNPFSSGYLIDHALFQSQGFERRSFTSGDVAWRSVSPASRRFPASKLLRPFVVKAFRNAFSPTQRGDAFSPRNPAKTMRIFPQLNIFGMFCGECSSPTYSQHLCCQRISYSSSPMKVTMNQFLLDQIVNSVSKTLTLDGHQTMKNRVLLGNYYLPGDLERRIGTFVDYYNTQSYHDSLGNITPADVYFGRDKEAIMREGERIKN